MTFVLYPLLLAALVAAAPTSEDFEYTERVTFTTDMYKEDTVIYEGKHDIADIIIPLNRATEIEDNETIRDNMLIFFVEADKDDTGKKTYRGIYVYKGKEAFKVMENGRAVAASADDSPYVFLGGDDGLYLYEPKTITAKKYGDFDYAIKDMAKENNNDVIYILTDDEEVYKVSDAVTRKEKLDELKGAQQIVMDLANNLFYLDAHNKPYVRRTDGTIMKIEGLPEAKDAKLVRPPFINEGVEFLADNEFYAIYPNGKSEPENFEFVEKAKPTALSIETFLYKYFGYNKKIYEFYMFSSDTEHNSEEETGGDNNPNTTE